MDPTCRSCSDYPCTCGRAIGVPIDNGPGKPWTIRAGMGMDMTEINYDDYLAQCKKSEEEAKARRELELIAFREAQEKKREEWLSDSSVVDQEIANFMMWKAVKDNNAQLLRTSMDRGADPTIHELGHSWLDRETKFFNSLHHCCSKGYFDAVQILLDPKYNRKAQLIDSNSGTSNTQFTPLIFAVTSNHLEIVKFLLKEGANKNIDDGWGKTPIKHAREKGFTEIIKVLES